MYWFLAPFTIGSREFFNADNIQAGKFGTSSLLTCPRDRRENYLTPRFPRIELFAALSVHPLGRKVSRSSSMLDDCKPGGEEGNFYESFWVFLWSITPSYPFRDEMKVEGLEWGEEYFARILFVQYTYDYCTFLQLKLKSPNQMKFSNLIREGKNFYYDFSFCTILFDNESERFLSF